MPMNINEKLNLDKDGKPVSEKVYQEMIESLLYLTASQLDIMFSVWLCAGFKHLLKSLISLV